MTCGCFILSGRVTRIDTPGKVAHLPSPALQCKLEALFYRGKRVTPVNRLPTWRELHMDTTPEADAILCAFWRDASPARKVKIMNQLNRTMRTLALSGL